MECTRRELGRMALVTVPGALLAPAAAASAVRQAAKPSSKFAGVQVGLNVPYSFRGQLPGTADDIISISQQLGLSALELRMQPVEHALGSPAPYPAAVPRPA